jgi:Zn-finger nucleic acid-binding protein
MTEAAAPPAPEVIPEDEACVLGHPEPVKRYVGLVCRRHYSFLADTLTQIIELAALVNDVLQPNTGQIDGPRSNDIDAPAPLRLHVAALTDPRTEQADDWWDEPDIIPNVMRAMAGWVVLIAEETRDEQPGTTTDDYRELATVTTYCHFLTKHRHWIARQEWLSSYVQELTAIHRVIASSVGDSMWPRSIGPCPNCKTKLYNEIGIDAVTCRRCRTTWTGVHLVRLRLILERKRWAAPEATCATTDPASTPADSSAHDEPQQSSRPDTPIRSAEPLNPSPAT